MFVPSIERLVLMIRENGLVVLNDNGIWQQRADGDALLFTDAIGRKSSAPLPRAFFNAWRRTKLISRDMSVPTNQGRIFALTKTGREVGTGGLHRRPGVEKVFAERSTTLKTTESSWREPSRSTAQVMSMFARLDWLEHSTPRSAQCARPGRDAG